MRIVSDISRPPRPSATGSAHALGHAERDRQLVGARQLLEMPQRKMLEEDRRRSVQQRTAEPFGATDDVDEAALVQRLEHAADGHAADLFDFGAADRLAIRDDRQRLERRAGQAGGRAANCARSIASVYSARVRICQPPPISTSSTPWPSTS